MAAYFILTQEVTDMQRYKVEDGPGVMPFLKKNGAEILVGDFAAEPLQGDPPSGVVVIRFPSKDAIRNFLDDPDYQPVKAVRLAITTNANAVMAPEFGLPPR